MIAPLHAFLTEYQIQKVKLGRERDAGRKARLCAHDRRRARRRRCLGTAGV